MADVAWEGEMPRVIALLLLGMVCGVWAGCSGEEPPYDDTWARSVSRVFPATVEVTAPEGTAQTFQLPYFKDEHGRYVQVYGINLSGSTKFPETEQFPSLYADKEKHVSYHEKPFVEEEADEHFARIQAMGFNAVRFLLNWEGIQPYGPDEFDEEYLDYMDRMVAKAGEYGLYVLLDMHQDMFTRHMFAYYDEHPKDKEGKEYEKGSLEAQLLGLIPPMDDWSRGNWVRGEGAPLWVAQACLPEKVFDSPAWGTARLLYGFYGITKEEALARLTTLTTLITKLMGGSMGSGTNEWLEAFFEKVVDDPASHLAEPVEGIDIISQTNDFLPFTIWGVTGILSSEFQRLVACFFAGDQLMPNYVVDGKHISTWLQDQYAAAWSRVAERVADNPNVIGYDIMNEPAGFFLILTAIGLYFQTEADEAVQALLVDLLGKELGENLFSLIGGFGLLPKDTTDETMMAWGFKTDEARFPDLNYDIDMGKLLDLNYGYDAKFLQPMIEKVGAAILKADPNAVIWFEPSLGLSLVTGGELPQWQVNMTRPKGIEHAVFAPHWYPDIYPYLGINQKPREFAPEEWKYRDFAEPLLAILDKSAFSFSNMPTVLGEFGTYFNFGGIEASKASDYLVSTQILDAFYRAFEEIGMQHHMQWCYSPENTNDDGEGWNKEDFSAVGPGPEFGARGWRAYVRPHARATSGKVIATHFYSPLHPQDPEKGEPVPVGEFHLEMESRETAAPTEIFVPARQYPDGFYVWVSDGACFFDHERQILYWHPAEDAPGATHTITILPPREGADVHDWDYLFVGEQVFSKVGGVQ
jgi:aryl-phospho-beta-D-glucosidase BglC (GH1 family)